MLLYRGEGWIMNELEVPGGRRVKVLHRKHNYLDGKRLIEGLTW